MGMRRLPVWIALLASCVPGPGADWLTDAGNVQRTNFQKDEKILSPDTVKGMQLLWKLHVENETRQMHALFPVLVVGRVNTAKGPKQIAIETGVSDNLYAIDVETGQPRPRAAEAAESFAPAASPPRLSSAPRPCLASTSSTLPVRMARCIS